MTLLANNKELRLKYGKAAKNEYSSKFIFEKIVSEQFVNVYKNKKPFRLLFDANPIINGNKSGVGYYTYYLIEALAERYPLELQLVGHYFNFLGRKQNITLPKTPNISYKQSRIVPGKILSITRKLHFQPPLELFFKQRADAALFTNFVSLPSLFHTPTHIVVHDMCFEDVPEYVAEKNRRFLHEFVPKSIKKAHQIITISEFSKNSIMQHYGVNSDNIVITPIPAEQLLSPSNEADITSIVSGNYILFVGTLEPRKNILGLVKGYEQLPAKIKKEFALVLAGGSGWYFEETLSYIKNLIKNGENIVLTGYITDEQKNSLYRHASVFTSASHYEGFGMPVLEAMSCGTPTVISDIPVFREVAEDASVYFDKDDPASVAQALADTLSDNALRSTLIAKGNAIAASYSWKKVAEDLYNSITKQKD